LEAEHIAQPPAYLTPWFAEFGSGHTIVVQEVFLQPGTVLGVSRLCCLAANTRQQMFTNRRMHKQSNKYDQ
jgi:hypothetical protein